ncbi:adipocyte plasma membrane-associated protein-like [Babylonia areolata]|uniref:adipocyte plasma membrane-associated protein-like n=1 Tax=Babylonia areolata TaxID=304850 RepID=UPI003FD0E4B9
MVASIVTAVVVALMVFVGEVAAQGDVFSQMPNLPETNLKPFSLPPPPALVGPLAPNSWLSKARKYMMGLVSGPESMVVVNRYIYTGLSDGRVVEISPQGTIRLILKLAHSACGGTVTSEAICGRPLGIRADSNRNLVVVDPYKGIFRINPTHGNFTWLMWPKDVEKEVGKLEFLNDLTVTKNGLIFFTSSSAKYPRNKFMNIILEGDKSGRVLVYNPLAPRGNRVREVARNLHFPNGLQLTKDETSLLVAEGARAKIHKISLKTGAIETFADNLPGFVDNIRLSPRGTYWVALSSARYKDEPGVLDKYGPHPRVRQLILSMPMEQIMARAPKYGIVVELNADGQIIRSLHDPTGAAFTAVSEVEEEKGLLFLGSYSNKYIGVLSMSLLPTPVEPTTPPPATTTPVPPLVTLPPTTNPQVNFLNHVRAVISQMSKERLQQIILVLVQLYLESRLDAPRAVERANSIQEQLNAATSVGTTSAPGKTLSTEFSAAANAAETTSTAAAAHP